MGRFARLLSVVFVVALSRCNTAAAQDVTPESRDSAARQAFHEGLELAAAEKWTRALAAFERSASLRLHAVTTYNIGYCERALGRWTRAKKKLLQALEQHRSTDRDALSDANLRSISELLSEIEPSLAHLKLTVSPRDATVTIDGRPLERMRSGDEEHALVAGTLPEGKGQPLPQGTAVVSLDPGPHVVVVRKAGYAERVRVIRLEPGGSRELAVELGVGLAHGDQTLATKDPELVQAPRQIDESAPVAGYSFLGGGLIGFGVGSFFALKALDARNDARKDCSDEKSPVCLKGARDALDADARYSLIADVAFGVGVAASAVGVYLLVTHSDRPAPTTAGVRLSTDGAGGVLQLQGLF
jgi:tetratricopeptide (TPR) repeat protein